MLYKMLKQMHNKNQNTSIIHIGSSSLTKVRNTFEITNKILNGEITELFNTALRIILDSPDSTENYLFNFENIKNYRLNITYDRKRARLNFYYIHHNEIKKALNLFSQILDIKPNHILSLEFNGIGNYKIGNYEKALIDLNTIMQINELHKQAIKYSSLSTARLGDVDGAIKYLKIYIELYPTSILSFNEGVFVVFREIFYEFSNTKEEYYDSMGVDLVNAHNYREKGSYNYKQGNINKAIYYYTKAINDNPIDSFSYRKRGILKNKLNDQAGAKKDFEVGQSINNDFAEFFYENAFTIGKRDISMYILLTLTISFNPNYADAYFNRGVMARNMFVLPGQPTVNQNFSSKIKDVDIAIQINPKNADFYLHRSELRKTYEPEAIEDCNKAIEVDPNYAKAYRYRGYLKYDLEDFKGAIEDFNKADKIAPNDDAWYYDKRGSTKEFLNDYEGAIEEYIKAIKIYPDNTYFNGQYRKAKARLENH